MKIALLLYGHLDLLSGGFLYDRLLVDSLNRRGDKVDIVSLPWKKYVPGLMDNTFLTPKRLLEGKRYDLVLQDALAHPSLLRFNLEMKRGPGYPIFSILHSLYSNGTCSSWNRAIFRKLEGFYFRSVDGLVFNSDTTRSDAEAAAGRKLKGVVAFPGGDRLGNGISEDEIVKRGLRPGPLEILFAGSMTRHKGLHILLEALGRLSSIGSNGNWRLTVAGNERMEPAYVQDIRSKIERSGWSSQVRLLGDLRTAEMASCFSTSHLLAVPSVHEGFGMAYIEGMAFGLPAIGSIRGGAREIINHEENGFLLEPGDVRSLSSNIGRLLDRRDLLIELSLNAKRRHRAHPTWATILATIHSFLDDQVHAG